MPRVTFFTSLSSSAILAMTQTMEEVLGVGTRILPLINEISSS